MIKKFAFEQSGVAPQMTQRTGSAKISDGETTFTSAFKVIYKKLFKIVF